MTWRLMTEEEASAPLLDCSALSREGCDQVRDEFKAASTKAMKALMKHLQRIPTQAEVDIIHGKLVSWFNEERIPYIKPEIVH